jgi:predicted RNase H-like HicB family nuclease
VNNLKQFRHPELDRVDEPVATGPDAEKLQRLLGQLVEATSGLGSQAPRDREVRIRNFRSERMELLDDLIIVIEQRGNQYVATSYDTGQYGHGYSPDDAIQELCSAIEDYHDLLTEDEERLSPHLQAHLRYLRSILRERA